MAKKPGTILREYTQEYLVHLKSVDAKIECFDGKLKENRFSNIDYSVIIDWYAGTLCVEATKDNKLIVTAMEARDLGNYVNSFQVTGYYVMKDTIKGVWESLEYAVYTADTNMETIYDRIVQVAKQTLYS